MDSIELLTVKIERHKLDLPFSVRSINSPDKVEDILKYLIGDSDREHMVIILLDTKLHVTAAHIVSIGTVNSSMVHPREVFKAALLHNSSNIVLGHNHPTGDPTPSDDDIKTTERIVKGAEILGIRVLDHIIITDSEDLFSFKNEGLL